MIQVKTKIQEAEEYRFRTALFAPQKLWRTAVPCCRRSSEDQLKTLVRSRHENFQLAGQPS